MSPRPTQGRMRGNSLGKKESPGLTGLIKPTLGGLNVPKGGGATLGKVTAGYRTSGFSFLTIGTKVRPIAPGWFVFESPNATGAKAQPVDFGYLLLISCRFLRFT